MRSFPLYDYQVVILLSFLGVITLVLLYIAFRKIVFPPFSGKGLKAPENFPDGIQTSQGPIPLILIFVYAGFFVWALTYVIFIAVRNEPF